MILISATARIKADKREEVLAAAANMRQASLAEPGCRQYRFGFALDDSDVILVFEEWDDQAALDAHFRTPHMVEFTAALGEVLAGAPEITRHEVTSSAPLFG